MPFEQAVFLRIDTSDAQPYLDGASCGELVISALVNGRDRGWFELIGFVVLPREIQLMIIPRRMAVSTLVNNLEHDLYPQLSVLRPVTKTILDTDFYREKVDCDEELKQRLRWMHLSPVRARLSMLPESYPFSSANARYREIIRPLQQA
jgi:hypothetical protein